MTSLPRSSSEAVATLVLYETRKPKESIGTNKNGYCGTKKSSLYTHVLDTNPANWCKNQYLASPGISTIRDCLSFLKFWNRTAARKTQFLQKSPKCQKPLILNGIELRLFLIRLTSLQPLYQFSIFFRA